MKTQYLDHDSVKETVRERYQRIAQHNTGCGCAPTCCGPTPDTPADRPDAGATAQGLGYSSAETQAVPEGSNLGLGCGNPQAIAALRPGETVLDLGSGAGFDAFLAAAAVGPTGRVIGVDMTPAMINKARQSQRRGGYKQVQFRLGEIENLPVADATVDVIISNCVVNLSPDKPRVLREAFRVLRSGGRLAISDIVAVAPIPQQLQGEWELYTGCVTGASRVEELDAMLRDAGFREIRIDLANRSHQIVSGWFPGQRVENFIASATIKAVKS